MQVNAVSRLDVCYRSAYLGLHMFRKLVTLLALLTGLAAIGAPTHARMEGVREAQVAMAGDASGQCQEQRQTLNLAASDVGVIADARGKDCRTRTIVVHLPTVMLGSDRSRE